MAENEKTESHNDRTQWNLRLYVAGQTPKSRTAFLNLKKICEEYLQNQYTIEIIDLIETPKLARGDQIFAVPTLVRKLPEPIKRIIGDLSDTERVLVGARHSASASRQEMISGEYKNGQ